MSCGTSSLLCSANFLSCVLLTIWTVSFSVFRQFHFSLIISAIYGRPVTRVTKLSSMRIIGRRVSAYYCEREVAF
jgi:hypothetical protein